MGHDQAFLKGQKETLGPSTRWTTDSKASWVFAAVCRVRIRPFFGGFGVFPFRAALGWVGRSPVSLADGVPSASLAEGVPTDGAGVHGARQVDVQTSTGLRICVTSPCWL